MKGTTMTQDMPASNIDAEKYILAAIMTANQAVIDVCEVVAPDDFYRPLHRSIFLEMVNMYSASEAITPITLRAWLERDKIRFDPAYLLTLYHIPAVGQAAVHHARLVWECAVRRRIEELGHRLVQLAAMPDQAPESTIARAREYLDALSAHCTPDTNRAIPLDEFLAMRSDRLTPVIPGLIDHEDRVVVVGMEGDGKTTLAYQVAMALGAGIHPFAFSAIPALKVLIIDLENPRQILQRRLRGLREKAAQYANFHPENIALFARPGGIALWEPGQAFGLADVVQQEKPDLIVAGPIYKMLEETGDHDQNQHAAICRFFDAMRERHGSAIWLETHAPIMVAGGKRAMRPIGSGIWSRWPEFGIALARGKDKALMLERFRGDREDDRQWPEKISRTHLPRPSWPWEPTYAAGTFMDPLSQQ